MTLFKRKNIGGVEPGLVDREVVYSSDRFRPRGVGASLREARESAGGSIEQIGAGLRIRPAYLEAIEESRWDRLPGPTYAVGFVRTYAEHLGLDGAEMARRFKEESAGLEQRRDLAFPMPLPERSRPGGAIFLVALILAACAYGTWYYISAGERARPPRVAALPSELLPPPAPPPAPAISTPTVSTAPAAGPAGEAAPAPTAPAGSPAGPPPVAPVEAAPPVAPSPATTPAPAAVSAGAPSAAVPLPPVSPAPPPTASQQPSAPPPVNAAPQTAPASTATAALPPAPPEGGIPSVPEAPAATAADAPRVYGVSNGPSRITIRATADSWIQIREGGSAQARVLKPGESYRVPDRPGITMRTGNAGGIEILVDGKQAPPLGPMGKPRNAVLDPARLLAGTAIGE